MKTKALRYIAIIFLLALGLTLNVLVILSLIRFLTKGLC